MSIAIIGYTGFIGSYLRTKLEVRENNCDLYNSKNIQTIIGKEYDTVYCCGLPATKWMINKDPVSDLNNILNLQGYLKQAIIKKFILISTIDVYDKAKLNQNENSFMITNETYGKHRFMMEGWVNENYSDIHILRLPGIFGYGLKKNVVYDILNNKYDMINPYNIFQWYYLEDLMTDIDMVVKNNIKLINLFSEPIQVIEFINAAKVIYDINEYFEFKSQLSVKYDYNTILNADGYYCSKNYILTRLVEFMENYKKLNNLVVSNLCWSNDYEDYALFVLKRYGITNLELAITRYYSWDELDNINSMKYLDTVVNLFQKFKGFNIYSLQALFFGKSFNVFVDKIEFIKHFKKVIDIAIQIEAKALVFGSPFNRKLPDTFENPDEYFIDVLKELGNYCKNKTSICLEPNATEYGCNYITTINSALDIIRKVNNNNVLLNLDTGNAMMMKDNVNDIDNSLIGHIQISAPYLKSISEFSIPKLPKYTCKKSLEMREVPKKKFEENILAFINL